MNRTFKHERQKFKTSNLITKFTGDSHMNEPSWVVLRLPPTNPRWWTVALLNFVKC